MSDDLDITYTGKTQNWRTTTFGGDMKQLYTKYTWINNIRKNQGYLAYLKALPHHWKKRFRREVLGKPW